MKTTAIPMVMAALICAAQAQKQEPPSDPLSKHLVKPSLIFSKAEAIGLSSEQHDQIRTVVEKAHGEIGASQKALRPAYSALQSELAESPVDIEAATQQLDKVLDLERGMKRLHLRMLAEANNLLSSEQRAKLRAMNLS
ncbi:MAG: Spy/CpxP family protein refolding chaperone, partial [Verrucomicrobiales bacterium]